MIRIISQEKISLPLDRVQQVTRLKEKKGLSISGVCLLFLTFAFSPASPSDHICRLFWFDLLGACARVWWVYASDSKNRLQSLFLSFLYFHKQVLICPELQRWMDCCLWPWPPQGHPSLDYNTERCVTVLLNFDITGQPYQWLGGTAAPPEWVIKLKIVTRVTRSTKITMLIFFTFGASAY